MDDNELVASRKLTESEATKLRSLLKSQLNIAAGSSQQQAEEDAADLLDYAFAMIANGSEYGLFVFNFHSRKVLMMEVIDDCLPSFVFILLRVS